MTLLDTDACIFILRGKKLPRAYADADCAISTITETELWVGASRSGNDAEADRVELLISALDVLPFDRKAARQAGEVIADLLKRGLKLDGPDPFIAGHALSLGVPIITGNVSHFKRVKGLEVIPWRPK